MLFVLARELMRRVSHAKRACSPLLFVIGHTPQQHACSGARVSLGGVTVNKKTVRRPFFRQRPRQWSAATFGVPMTNNKGPQVRLA
jgi:hypothetical protein